MSGTYALEPHGITFLQPLQINCEYDEQAAFNAGGQMMFFRSQSSINGPWTAVPGGTFNAGFASLQVRR